MKRLFYSCLLTSLTCFACAQFFCSSLVAQERKTVDFPGDVAYDYGSEPMRYLENDRVKLGLNMALGGAVTYLEDKVNRSGNMINSCDWGRQIQLSYYSGPNPYVGPNGEKPEPYWAELGWNPIQSGDYGGYRSQVLEFTRPDDSSIFLRTRPMLWPHTGVPAECVFECRYQLIDNGFSLEATIVNNRSDKTQYPGRNQETPAVYTNAPWYKLATYLGDKPFENEPVHIFVDKNDGGGWPPAHYYSPERWTAILNENNCGLGVYQPLCTLDAGGFHGGDEAKGKDLGDKSGPTGYISPFEQAILDWNVRYTYKTTFILGTLDEIRSTVYELAKNDVPKRPNWIFKSDRQRWVYLDAHDEGYPIVDSLKIAFSADKQGTAVSPGCFWRAEESPVLEIEAAFENVEANQNVDDVLSVRLTPVSPIDCIDSFSIAKLVQANGGNPELKEYPKLPIVETNVPIKFDGEKRTIRVNLNEIDGYVGAMREIKLIFPARNGKAKLYRVGLTEK